MNECFRLVKVEDRSRDFQSGKAGQEETHREIKERHSFHKTDNDQQLVNYS